ncbi:MAG: YopX family protein [Eubacteriaceae bacterium]
MKENRLIKFRGIRKRDFPRNFVYGYLVKKVDSINNGYFIIDNCSIIEVNEDTVEQFTGLTDKNGKEIFEGDIVIYMGATGKVYYESYSAMFMVRFNLHRCVYSFDSMDEEIKVIGNIHENKDLLK